MKARDMVVAWWECNIKVRFMQDGTTVMYWQGQGEFPHWRYEYDGC